VIGVATNVVAGWAIQLEGDSSRQFDLGYRNDPFASPPPRRRKFVS
jgi:hypothetical protein